MLPKSIETIKAYVGDDFVATLKIKSNGLPLDVSDWLNWRSQLRGTSKDDIFNLDVDSSMSQEGILVIKLHHSVVEKIPAGTYKFDIQATRNDFVRTFVTGKIKFVDDVTKPGG